MRRWMQNGCEGGKEGRYLADDKAREKKKKRKGLLLRIYVNWRRERGIFAKTSHGSSLTQTRTTFRTTTTTTMDEIEALYFFFFFLTTSTTTIIIFEGMRHVFFFIYTSLRRVRTFNLQRDCIATTTALAHCKFMRKRTHVQAKRDRRRSWKKKKKKDVLYTSTPLERIKKRRAQ